VSKLVGLALVLAACGEPRAFHCDVDGQCVLGGVPGRCEANGFCSFPDVSCASGSRYGEYAPPDVRGTCLAGPPNAFCDAAEALALGSSVDGTLRGAGESVQLSCSPLATSEVFYAIDLPECSDVTIQAQAAGGDLAVALTHGCLTELGCVDASPGAAPESLEVDGVPAGAYEIAVAGVQYDGALSISAAIAPPPPNATAADAMALMLPAHLEQSLARANDVTACAGHPGGRDLFYKVSIPALKDSTDHWTLEVNIGSPVSDQFEVSLTDSTGTTTCMPVSSGLAKFVGPVGAAADDYVIAVDGPVDGSCGHFTLDVKTTEVSPNDDCSQPYTQIPDFQFVEKVTETVRLDQATNDFTGSCGGSGNDVVYQLTTNFREHVRITVKDQSPTSTSVPVVYLRGPATACEGATEATYTAAGSCDPHDPSKDVPSVPNVTACAKGLGTAVLDMDELAIGNYFLVVDSDTGGGTFDLTVERLFPVGDTALTATPLPDFTAQQDGGCCDLGTTLGASAGGNVACEMPPTTSPDVYRKLLIPQGCGVSGTFSVVSAAPANIDVTAPAQCRLNSAPPSCPGSTLEASGWYRTDVVISSAPATGPCEIDLRISGGSNPPGAFAVTWFVTDMPAGTTCP
jgi:hypothetical protein